jgi:UDP-glucose 4-epimerase
MRSNLDGLTGDLAIVEGSVTSTVDVEAAIEGCDGIFHLAAIPSVPRSVEEPILSHESNTTGTVVVLDVARRNDIKVVYAGSSSAYGEQASGAVSEELRESPMSPYAAAKLAGELNCRAFAHVYKLPVVVVRFFNVYGPRQVADSPYSGVVAAFAHALLRGEKPIVHGDGQQSRDFTYVEDVARGCLLAMKADTEGCETMNLACGGSHSVLSILETLKTCAGSDATPEFAPSRAGDIRDSCADTTRALERLGFKPNFTLADGLEKTYDWYRSIYA